MFLMARKQRLRPFEECLAHDFAVLARERVGGAGKCCLDGGYRSEEVIAALLFGESTRKFDNWASVQVVLRLECGDAFRRRGIDLDRRVDDRRIALEPGYGR